jgi:hypothetical protein
LRGSPSAVFLPRIQVCKGPDSAVVRYSFPTIPVTRVDERNRDLSSTDNEWSIIHANNSSSQKNFMSDRRLFVPKGLHGIDLRDVTSGNVAGNECDQHQ